MSKVLIDRELLAGLVSNDRETRLDAERRMYGVLANQPAEAEGVDSFQIARHSKRLVEQLRNELSAVTAERDRFERELLSLGEKLIESMHDKQTIRAEVEGLRKALEQYADDGNWCYDTCNVSRDVAKAALAAKEA